MHKHRCRRDGLFFLAVSLLGIFSKSAAAETVDLSRAVYFDWAARRAGMIPRPYAFVSPGNDPAALAAKLRKGDSIRLTTEDAAHYLVLSAGLLPASAEFRATKIIKDGFRRILIVRTLVVLRPAPADALAGGKKAQAESATEKKGRPLPAGANGGGSDKAGKKTEDGNDNKEEKPPSWAELVKLAAAELAREERARKHKDAAERKRKAAENAALNSFRIIPARRGVEVSSTGKTEGVEGGRTIVGGTTKDETRAKASAAEKSGRSGAVASSSRKTGASRRNPAVFVPLGKLEGGRWCLRLEATVVDGGPPRKCRPRDAFFLVRDYREKKTDDRRKKSISNTPGLGPLIDPRVPSAIP